MSSRLNLTFFAALAIQMLMIGATAAPLADGLNPMGDYEKMDKSLRNSLKHWRVLVPQYLEKRP
jgi:hypothetical protein